VYDALRRKVAVGPGCDLDVVAMQNFGDGSEMTGEVALRSLRHSASTPGDQDMLRKTGVWILDFDEGKLDAAFVEILD
jgi:hypothetical protein